jgi:hypothetical protein
MRHKRLIDSTTHSILLRAVLMAGSLGAIWLPTHLTLHAQPQDRISGYYFTYTCSAPDGRSRADRVSNIYYTRLVSSKRNERIRAILGGYRGCMGDSGAYATAAQADEYRAKFYPGLPGFTVPDPLN